MWKHGDPVMLLVDEVEDAFIFAGQFTGWRGYCDRATQSDVDKLYEIVVRASAYLEGRASMSILSRDDEVLKAMLLRLEDRYIKRVWVQHDVRLLGVQMTGRPWWHRWL